MGQRQDDRITIYLAIESASVTPSDLTERLGVRPDRAWVIGEPRGRTGMLWECHGWVIETTVRSEEYDGRSATELLPIGMRAFLHRATCVAGVISHLGSSVQRHVVISIVADEAPGIELDPPFLRLLVDLGGSLQVDLNGI